MIQQRIQNTLKAVKDFFTGRIHSEANNRFTSLEKTMLLRGAKDITNLTSKSCYIIPMALRVNKKYGLSKLIFFPVTCKCSRSVNLSWLNYVIFSLMNIHTLMKTIQLSVAISKKKMTHCLHVHIDLHIQIQRVGLCKLPFHCHMVCHFPLR